MVACAWVRTEEGGQDTGSSRRVAQAGGACRPASLHAFVQ
jgi:hypothetical protein